MRCEDVTVVNDDEGAAVRSQRARLPRRVAPRRSKVIPFVEVRVPASTSNLGAGFDCFGLALRLYLDVRATVSDDASAPCVVRSTGEGGGAELPRTGDNLIFRAMRFAAEREGLSLPPVRLAARNEIPLGRGLGSSAAAIVAGLKLAASLCGHELEGRDAAALRDGA